MGKLPGNGVRNNEQTIKSNQNVTNEHADVPPDTTGSTKINGTAAENISFKLACSSLLDSVNKLIVVLDRIGNACKKNQETKEILVVHSQEESAKKKQSESSKKEISTSSANKKITHSQSGSSRVKKETRKLYPQVEKIELKQTKESSGMQQPSNLMIDVAKQAIDLAIKQASKNEEVFVDENVKDVLQKKVVAALVEQSPHWKSSFLDQQKHINIPLIQIEFAKSICSQIQKLFSFVWHPFQKNAVRIDCQRYENYMITTAIANVIQKHNKFSLPITTVSADQNYYQFFGPQPSPSAPPVEDQSQEVKKGLEQYQNQM